MNLTFTADTGATRTIISDRIYNKIDPKKRPELRKTACLTGAGGTRLKEYGKANFNIMLGDISLTREIIVAEIEDDALLGIDILQNDEGGPADILLSKGVIVLKGKTIPCIQIGMKNDVRKVTAADHFIIPPLSEAVIDVFIERKESDDASQKTDFIVEPTQHFCETYPLKMASVLVDLNRNPTSKIRLLNPFPYSVDINQDSALGQAEQIDSIKSTLKGQEHTAEEDNNFSVRRVTISNKSEQILNKVQEEISLENKEIPEHLQTLYHTSVKNCNEEEK